MAKIVITIEDAEDGIVLMTGNPTAFSIAEKANNDPDSMTPAEAYAFAAWQAMIEAANEVSAEVESAGGSLH